MSLPLVDRDVAERDEEEGSPSRGSVDPVQSPPQRTRLLWTNQMRLYSVHFPTSEEGHARCCACVSLLRFTAVYGSACSSPSGRDGRRSVCDVVHICIYIGRHLYIPAPPELSPEGEVRPQSWGSTRKNRVHVMSVWMSYLSVCRTDRYVSTGVCRNRSFLHW